MSEKSFQGIAVSSFFPGGSRHRPTPERIKAPGAYVEGAGLRRIGSFCSFSLRHVAISNSAKSRSPLVVVGAVNFCERLAHIRGIKANQRVHTVLGPLYSLCLDLLEGALFLLRWHGHCPQQTNAER